MDKKIYNLILINKKGSPYSNVYIAHVDNSRFLIGPELLSSNILNMYDNGSKLTIETKHSIYHVANNVTHQILSKKTFENIKKNMNISAT